MKKVLYYVVLTAILLGALAGFSFLNVLLEENCTFKLGGFLLAAFSVGTMCLFKPLIRKVFKIEDTKE